ncbi:MAG: autotransporter outer membrane beta-barrel domain-containing protein [Campylobacteraceae bacterium]|jgi:outer membrane autotransporter protein|nr:autotransporter outer membrane beta-barrel domain-containing protein [Campylobacteraceae bacterium]
MYKIYSNSCDNKKSVRSFSYIFIFVGLFLVSNLNADCVDLGGGHVVCDETVNSDIYANASSGVSSSSLLEVGVTSGGMHGVHNNNNGTWSFNGLNVDTKGANAYAVYAQNGANISVGNNVNLITNSTNSHAVNAESYSNINIGDNAKISTYGPDIPPTTHGVAVPVSTSYGIRAQYSNVTVGDNANILTTGVGSYGVATYEDSILLIGNNATIATIGGNQYCGMCGLIGEGWASTAVYVLGTTAVGSTVIIGNDANISIQGWGSALNLGRASSVAYIGDNTIITANGNRNSHAVSMLSGGNATIGDNAVITSTGTTIYYDDSRYNGQPHAVYGGGGANLIIGDNANIATYGYLASAVQFTDSSISIGDNARITTYGEGRYTGQSSNNEGGFGIKIRNGYDGVGDDKITVGNNAIITTYGNQSLGVQIREKSVGIFGDNLTILTYGNTATALETFDRSNVTVGDNAFIITQGDVSHAVRTLVGTSTSNANATTIIGKNAFITTQGDGSYAVTSEGRSIDAGSSINIADNASVGTAGINSYALAAQVYSDINVSGNSSITTEGDGSSAVYSQSGSHINIGDNSYILTKGNGAYALLSSAADITIADGSNISTTGANSHAINAQNGANIDVGDSAFVSTNGVGSYALNAQSGSNISIGNSAYIVTNGTDSHAVYATSNSNINIGDNANIITYGSDFPSQSRSHGVYAGFNSSITIGDNANILTTGVGSYGVGGIGSTGNDNVHITIGDNASIVTIGGDPNCGQCGLSPTTGWWSYGIYMGVKNSDITIGDNALVSTQGANAFAVAARNTNAAVYMGDNATIITYGNNGSKAIMIDSASKGVFLGDNAVITTYGNATPTGTNNPHAVQFTGDSSVSSFFVTGDNAIITTYGYDASAISASSYANVIIGDNARITTYGEGRYTGQSSSNEGGFGIKIRGSYGNLLLGNNALITTYGNQAVGVQIRERSVGTFGDNLTILTHGNTATALETYDRSNVTVGDNAFIATIGNASHAVHTLAYAGTTPSYAGNATTVIGKNSYISTEGDGSHALFVEGRSNNDSVVGIVLNTNTNISVLGDNSYALYSASNGIIQTSGSSKLNILGDITAVNNGIVDLDLKEGSTFIGNTILNSGRIDLALDGSNSLWRLKGNSSLTNLSLTNEAKVDLTKSPSYANLIIDNLSGNGVFYQRINLSETGDLITINDSSSGNHKLIFDDSALGGYTVDGSETFLVVEQNQSGTYNAVFTGEVYIGAYTYRINDINNTQYLTTGISNNSGGGSSGGPTINPIASSSISFSNINYISNYANTQTLLQRMGELDTDRDTLDDIWVRTYAGELDSFDKKFNIQDTSYYGLQAGFDRIYNIGNAKGFIGLTFGVSKTDINYKQGNGEVSSYDFGLYASYKNENKFYVDTLLKYTKNDNEFDMTTSNGAYIKGDANANSYSLSIESGKRFNVGSGFYIEPQAEFTFSKQSSGTSVASSGLKTKFDSYNSILGRAGTIIGYSLKDKTNVYYKIGYIKEFDGDISYSFNSSGDKQTYKLDGDVFDNAVGITSTIGDDHHIYFEGTYQIGDSFNNKKANLGYKYSF